MASFPRGFPSVPVQVRPPIVPALGEALPEGEIYIRLAEAMGLMPDAPAELRELAANVSEPAGAARYLKALHVNAKKAKFSAPLYWAYRTLGQHLDSPVLSSIWFQAVMNGQVRGDAVVRAFGPEWAGKDGFTLGLEVYRRLMEHPEGVEIARLDPAKNLDDGSGTNGGDKW